MQTSTHTTNYNLKGPHRSANEQKAINRLTKQRAAFTHLVKQARNVPGYKEFRMIGQDLVIIVAPENRNNVSIRLRDNVIATCCGGIVIESEPTSKTALDEVLELVRESMRVD